jgi:hypothetical protein
VTYEGTESVNALIVGREITGRSAFRPPEGATAPP